MRISWIALSWDIIIFQGQYSPRLNIYYLSLWLALFQAKTLLIAGFYKEWTRNGLSTEKSQIERIEIFSEQIESASNQNISNIPNYPTKWELKTTQEDERTIRATNANIIPEVAKTTMALATYDNDAKKTSGTEL